MPFSNMRHIHYTSTMRADLKREGGHTQTHKSKRRVWCGKIILNSCTLSGRGLLDISELQLQIIHLSWRQRDIESQCPLRCSLAVPHYHLNAVDQLSSSDLRTRGGQLMAASHQPLLLGHTHLRFLPSRGSNVCDGHENVLCVTSPWAVLAR